MTLQPPSGPDNTTEAWALSQVDALQQLSDNILSQADNPDLPRLNQWIQEWGHLLEAIQAIPLNTLSPEAQTRIRERLLQCQATDAHVEQQLQAHRSALETQLNSFKDSRSKMERYQSGLGDLSGTRSQDA